METVVSTVTPRVYPANDGERLAALEQCMVSIEKSVEDLEHKMDSRFDALSDDIKAFVKASDERYAAKQVEKLVYGVVGIVLTAIVYGLLDLLGLTR